MRTEYAVFDPLTGSHTHVTTEDDAVVLFAERVLAFAMPYFSNTPYMKVITNDDGTEQWATPDGTVVKSPKERIHDAVKAILQPTNVSVLP